MSGVQKLTVTADEAGMRLDRWFNAHFPAIKHGQLEKYLRKGEVRVEGGRVKASRRLEEGEIVRIPPVGEDGARTLSRSPASAAVSEAVSEEDARAIAEMTLHEDDDLLVLNKPFGVAVQGGKKTGRHIDAMLGALADGDQRPRLVHRLDKDTGGLLLVAKTRKAAQRLSEAFKGHDIDKTYWALVVGAPRPREGQIDMPIAKRMVRFPDGETERVVPADGEGAKRALTDFQIVEEAGTVSFIAMRPITGRTHQLRVHAAAIGAPIVGDGKYGGEAARIEGLSPKLHLFCRSMTFRHPGSGKTMTFTAPLTGHMRETWRFFSFDQNAQTEWPEIDS